MKKSDQDDYVRVAVRVRPNFNDSEHETAVDVSQENQIQIGSHEYTFDKVFLPNAVQV